MKKRFVQSCAMPVSTISERKTFIGKKVSPNHVSPSKKELLEVYNKFYRDQVSALYRVIREGK